MKRRLLLLATILIVAAQRASAVNKLPFHASSWITWIKPDLSKVGAYGGNLDGLSVFAYAFDKNDDVIQEDPSFVNPTLAKYKTDTQGGRRPTFVTIVNDVASGVPTRAGDIRHNPDVVQRVLSDPIKRAKHIQQLVALAPLADGIEIDYEALHAQTQPFYSLFIKELRAALPAGKLLVIDAQPKTDTQSGERGRAIDWQAVIPYLDQIRVLAYYYSYQGSAPGAVVSPAQTQALADFARNNQAIPIDKLHIVFSVFGWDWPLNGKPGQIVQYDEAIARAKQFGVTPFRDPQTNVLRVNYKDANGVDHQIWIDDAQSLISKIMMVLNTGIRHVDFWHIGTGDPALWQWIAANTTNFPDPPDTQTPFISQLQPSTARPGGPAFTLSVLGANFEKGAVIRWNGQDRPTTFQNKGRLAAAIPATDVASDGVVAVTVFNPLANQDSTPVNFYVHEKPTITTLTPGSARVLEDPGFTLTVDGAGFTVNSIVQWNGSDRNTTFVSPTQLTAEILNSDLLNRANVPVTVANPLLEGGASNGKVFPVRLVPRVNQLVPNIATVGQPAFTLTLYGSRFASDSVVRWNGQDRPTQLVSASTVTASISAADLSVPGEIPVVVFNASPGGTSERRLFIVNLPGAIVPTITGLNPPGVKPGSPNFVLQVLGTKFQKGAVVEWETVALPTVFVSATELRATIPASNVTTPGKFNLTVRIPAPSGGVSAATLFIVSANQTGPLISSVSPPTANAGGPAFTLTLTGSGFLTNSAVQWNGSARPTSFASSTQLSAAIPASDISSIGTAEIVVLNPTGNDASPPWTYVISSPTVAGPALTSLSPGSARAGSSAFTLTVFGARFTNNSAVQWNGLNQTTVFLGSSTLKATIPAADLSSTGTVKVSVQDGSLTSNTLPFTILGSTAPILFSLFPSSVTAGSPSFLLTVVGRNFTPAGAIEWNGVARGTTFVSSTTLRAFINATDVATPGTASVTEIDQSQQSNALFFVITGTGSSAGGAVILNSISPSSATVGGVGFTLTLTGSNFTASSQIRWNGNARSTLFINSTQIQAVISDSDLIRVGQVSIVVFDPVTGTSQPQTFSILQAAAAGVSDLGAARIYPNPWAADQNSGPIHFDRLPPDSTVKIFTISARWVKTLAASGGAVNWDRTNDSGDAVAAGYYIYLITDSAGHKTKGKLAIVR